MNIHAHIDPSPCPACGCPALWIDSYSTPHCHVCSQPRFPSQVRERLIILDCPPRWLPIHESKALAAQARGEGPKQPAAAPQPASAAAAAFDGPLDPFPPPHAARANWHRLKAGECYWCRQPALVVIGLNESGRPAYRCTNCHAGLTAALAENAKNTLEEPGPPLVARLPASQPVGVADASTATDVANISTNADLFVTPATKQTVGTSESGKSGESATNAAAVDPNAPTDLWGNPIQAVTKPRRKAASAPRRK